MSRLYDSRRRRQIVMRILTRKDHVVLGQYPAVPARRVLQRPFLIPKTRIDHRHCDAAAGHAAGLQIGGIDLARIVSLRQCAHGAGNHCGILIDVKLRRRFGTQRGDFALIERRSDGADDGKIAGYDAARLGHGMAGHLSALGLNYVAMTGIGCRNARVRGQRCQRRRLHQAGVRRARRCNPGFRTEIRRRQAQRETEYDSRQRPIPLRVASGHVAFFPVAGGICLRDILRDSLRLKIATLTITTVRTSQ